MHNKFAHCKPLWGACWGLCPRGRAFHVSPHMAHQWGFRSERLQGWLCSRPLYLSGKHKSSPRMCVCLMLWQHWLFHRPGLCMLAPPPPHPPPAGQHSGPVWVCPGRCYNQYHRLGSLNLFSVLGQKSEIKVWPGPSSSEDSGDTWSSFSPSTGGLRCLPCADGFLL